MSSEYHEWVHNELKKRGMVKRRPTRKERIHWRRMGMRLLAVWELEES